MGLRFKIFFPILILSLAFATYLQLIWLPKVSRLVENNYQVELKSHIKSVSESLIPFMIENQLANIYETLDSLLKQNANWVVIELKNSQGQRLYPLNELTDLSQPNLKLMEQKVGFMEPYNGVLHVWVDDNALKDKIEAIETNFRIVFILSLLFLLASLSTILEMIVIRPLHSLGFAASQLSKGNYITPIPPITNDETGRLTESFDTMRKALRAYHLQLVGEIDLHKKTAIALEQEKDRVSYQASHDSLTGLINRREFEARLSRSLEDAKSNIGNHVLLYIDLDQFKIVNDTCGHIAGDALLQQLSVILNDEIRQQDTLGRLGGDEFGVLLRFCKLDDAKQVAENLRVAIGTFQFVWQEKNFKIGASIGMVIIDSESGDVSHLLSSADSACYTAKENGRNQVQIYQPDNQLLARQQSEMLWITRIVDAMQENRFILYCQPINDISGNKSGLPHYEILSRLIDESGKIISPGSFIPAAERYNLINSIDRLVVKNTLDFLENRESPIHLSVNLSGTSLGDRKIQQAIIDKIRSGAIKNHQLSFEITESAAIISLSSAKYFMESLSKYGCRFALDDFGRGMSSYSYLKTLPVDYLKIDGMFVSQIDVNSIERAMVRSINEIAHTMKIQTIAEYVETEAVLDELKKIGVDFVQGYLLGKPFPLDELKE